MKFLGMKKVLLYPRCNAVENSKGPFPFFCTQTKCVESTNLPISRRKKRHGREAKPRHGKTRTGVGSATGYTHKRLVHDFERDMIAQLQVMIRRRMGYPALRDGYPVGIINPLNPHAFPCASQSSKSNLGCCGPWPSGCSRGSPSGGPSQGPCYGEESIWCCSACGEPE